MNGKILSGVISATIIFTACSVDSNEPIYVESICSVESSTPQYTDYSQNFKTSLQTFNPEINFSFGDNCIINWDNLELTSALEKATYIKRWLFDSCDESLFNNNGEEMNGFKKSGYSYQSFQEYIATVFTAEYTNVLFDENELLYKNINGELCYSSGGRGSNGAFDSIIFEVTEESSDMIILKATARYCHSDTPNEEYFKEFTYTVIKTEEGLRFDNFELWD